MRVHDGVRLDPRVCAVQGTVVTFMNRDITVWHGGSDPTSPRTARAATERMTFFRHTDPRSAVQSREPDEDVRQMPRGRRRELHARKIHLTEEGSRPAGDGPGAGGGGLGGRGIVDKPSVAVSWIRAVYIFLIVATIGLCFCTT